MSPSVDYVNNTRYDVRLNVRSKTRPVISRHVVLVLKSHVPVHWHVVTHSMRGTLDIFVSTIWKLQRIVTVSWSYIIITAVYI